MALTIANVLVGVASLGIRQPNDAIAEWSTDQHQGAGTHSVKLYKGGSGNAGSTHLEIIPPAGILGRGFTAAIAANKYEYYHYCSAVTGNFAQVEWRFEDPDSVGWAEITAIPLQNYLGTAAWVQQTSASADKVGYGGHKEDGSSFFDWDLGDTLASVVATINALLAGDMNNWILKRVRIELWEASPLRTMYVDTVKINDVSYTIEPGGTAPGMSLGSPYAEVGYTEDGVVFEYTADEMDIDVEEETFPINRVIAKETLAITCNMAESSLTNINNAIAGAVLAGSVVTLGDGINKTMNLKIAGTNPDGFNREIFVPLATSTGIVGMAYKKGEKTIVPVTIQALKGASDVCTIVDNTV